MRVRTFTGTSGRRRANGTCCGVQARAPDDVPRVGWLMFTRLLIASLLVLVGCGQTRACDDDDSCSADAESASYEPAACDESLAGSLREGATWQYDGGSVVTLDSVSDTTLEYGGTYEGC